MGAAPRMQINGMDLWIDLEGLGERAIVERCPPPGPEADVTYRCWWEDRGEIYKALMGGVEASGFQITRWAPHQFMWNDQLVCTEIRDVTGIKPRTEDDGTVSYDQVRFTAHYCVPPWDSRNNVSLSRDPSDCLFTSTKFKTSCEVFNPPFGSYYFTAGSYSGKPVNESGSSVVRPRVEIVVTRHMMPFVPLHLIAQCEGTVNDTTITFADHDFTQGTLLFVTGEPDQKADPSTGARCWDIAFQLLGNTDHDWNKFMDPGGQWNLINTAADGSGQPPFAYSDLMKQLLFDDDLSS